MLQDELQQFDATFVGDINYIILQAEDRIHKAVVLPNFKKNDTGNMTANNRFLAAPTDMISPFGLTLINNSVYTPLIFRESSIIYEMWGAASASAPRYYSLYNDSTFLLGPTPDQNYSVEFQYFYKPASITTVGSSGTTWLSTNAENCLLSACLLEGYIYMKGEDDLLKVFNDKYMAAINDLKRLGEGMNERDTYTDNDFKLAVTN
jgi:hypothetical protein